MRLWARLTWQAKDPAPLAAELARRLSVPARPGGLVPGARLLDLDTALLEVRPWMRETPDDAPRAAGRLLLEPVPGGEEPPRELRATGSSAGEAPGNAPASSGVSLIGVGWVTVEVERSTTELEPWLGPRAAAPAAGLEADERGLLPDEHLGARAALHASAGLPGSWTVLLEPSTEGRVAASLARDGEGPAVLYLRPAAGLGSWLATAREAGVTASAVRDGPFGPQVLLAGGPAGPHVIVTEGRKPVAAAAPPGTIAP